MTKHDIKNRRYLGHVAAETNENRFPEGLPVLKCSNRRTGFDCVALGKSLNISELQGLHLPMWAPLARY